MKLILVIGLVFSSCNNYKTNDNSNKAKPVVIDSLDYQKLYDRNYDIADLKTFKDTTKYIVRLRYEPPFKTKSVIELDELSNGINLCVKQPVVVAFYGDTSKVFRSQAFNQLCYWYADKEAIDIKSLFNKFDNGKTKVDLSCKSCVDVTYWQIEIYNHGRYSSIRQDYISNEDWKLTNLIFKKVMLSKKNDYAIVY